MTVRPENTMEQVALQIQEALKHAPARCKKVCLMQGSHEHLKGRFFF